ncbi:MAG: hypothetical protein CUN55_03835 [Phototrophicales bacterium]|nr:MAG: hypothetical protein CUN55_03835 [Phototrophicales bacterium]
MMFFDEARNRDDALARRFRNRSILFFIILATIPCYLIGGVMLAVAPEPDTSSVINETVPPLQSTTSRIGSLTPTNIGSPTVTLFPELAATQTQRSVLQPTPFQFVPPTARPISTATPAPTLTLAPSATTIKTATPTNTGVPTNSPPIFTTPPLDVSLIVNETKTVSFAFSDANNDAISFTASSSAPSVAAITAYDVSAISVKGISVGSATITITLTDARGASTSDTFMVTVQAANQPPKFDVEPTNITLNQGANTTVTYMVSDPDGDTVTVEATSSDPSIASVTRQSANSFLISGNAAGTANLTVSISDGKGGIDGRTVTVTVVAASSNNPPSFLVEPAPITVAQGDSKVVVIQATDPDGDAVTLTVTSANNSILTATKIDNTSFTVQGVAVGNTTVTIRISDSKVNVDRVVNTTVTAPNAAPQFTVPPDDLSITASEVIEVDLFITDPDGDPITTTVVSSNPSIASVTKIDNVTFRVTGIAVGTTNVTITLNDGRGGSTSDVISVVVG